MKTNRFTIFVSILILCMATGLPAVGQNKSVGSLQAEIKRAQDEILVNTRLLEKTKSDQKSNATQLKLIRSRIDSRQKIVSSLEQQITIIDLDISMRGSDARKLEGQQSRLKSEYSRVLYESYKSYKLNNFLLLLFASEDFNDASRRLDFMRRYNRQMEIKGAEIDSISRVLTVEIGLLDAKKADIAQKRQSRSSELTLLSSDQKQYEVSETKLKSSENKISKELVAKRAAVKRAQDQITKIIAEENRKSNAVTRTAKQKQEDIELSGRFDQNKGKLPYPLRGGVVIDRFGVHIDPINRNVKVNNTGINIAGERGAKVYCVFEGTVSRVLLLPGLNYAVLMQHGNYRTVYANMESVAVKAGDKVSINQVVGAISNGSAVEDYMLHFEVWNSQNECFNPEHWLRR